MDNRITLRITCGGKRVVDKVFTKDNFASLVDAKFMKYSILEGWSMTRPLRKESYTRPASAIRNPTFMFPSD